MPETETEFQGYTGDCVWAAVHMGAHRLAPAAWPVPSATILNRLTSEAISAGIGVGPRGEATPGQLKTMLARWGMRYSVGYDYNGVPIAQAWLKNILDTALARGKPVLLGFTNGQALAGDESGLHGHEIVVLHPVTPAGYPCGDGDNPRCQQGELVYYPLAMLEAAQPDSAYILEEVPGEMIPDKWDDDGKTLISPPPAGVAVVRGFRAYVLSHGWDPNDKPFAPEYAYGGGSRQDFTYTSLLWTQATDVTRAQLGVERMGLDSHVSDLEMRLAAAQANAKSPSDAANATAIKALAMALQGAK